MSRRVLVCGGRDFDDAVTVDRVLFDMHADNPISVVIHGDCPTGADRLAKRWAYRTVVPQLPFPANWGEDGQRAAGPIRNARMLKESKPDVVVAFPGGNGTADMVRRARAAGVLVIAIVVDANR